MSTIDLSHFQSDAEPTSVLMPEGDTIELRPLMQLGDEHDALLLDVVGKLEKITKAAAPEPQASPKGPKGGKSKNPQAAEQPVGFEVDVSQLGEIMPLVGKLLRAAAPDQKSGARISRLPMMARFEVMMTYFQEQDLGGLFPSGS